MVARRIARAHVIPLDVATLGRPDAATIDALARLALVAGRLGCRIRLVHASPDMRDLIVLVGLAGVMPCENGSGVDARRQPEQREEPGSVEEEGDPADPVALQLEDVEGPGLPAATRRRLVLPEGG
jgi:hypothetical protein